ncbi:MAG TPA: anthranilate phosphoribosyltransferase [Kiritimatiellia bacterium]|nr:anthranilate phosphoribosyltransferase [Kiritimatiellia bacterium]HRZ11653.1 anthranilate phosphoribosyltransferase [Kiritimatiellia bacterium]HSA16796.1 anthranilate phosphoribosyltransferase [Kiritimatiellia bacterium]
MIREAIAKLVENRELTREEALAAMREIMAGEATPAQVAAYITALRLRGETPAVIAASAAAMREKFTAIPAPGEVVVDTCGTGGDGAHTFNISTAAAFVAAGAGITVAKHGNRSVSSKCGSADVLAELGVKIDCAPEVMAGCLRDIGIAFLFAPVLHPAMKHAIGPRREIGIRTIFNILGPLSNPAGARYGVLGVYHRDLVPVLAEAAASLGAQRLFVVHGADGLDELTTTGDSFVAEVTRGAVKTYTLNPASFGIPRARPEDLRGGDAKENAALVRSLLDGEKGPRRDIVLLNAAAAIVAGGRAADFAEGLQAAARSVDSGSARQKLAALARASNAGA